MRELQRGLWWWEAAHPQWTPEHDAAGLDWGPEVSSYAIDDGERLLLIDPTTPPSPVDEIAAERETVIVLTCPWHAWQFDVRTGESVTDDSKVAVYECKVEGGQVFVAI